MVTIEIDNKIFSGFEGFKLGRSIDNFCGTFSFVVIPTKDNIELLKVDTIINIKLNGIQAMKGKIYTRTRNLSATEFKLNVAGMDCTADILDCAAIQTNDSFTNITFETLAKKLCAPFNLFVDYLTTEIKLASFKLENGEFVYSALERVATLHGLLLKTNNWGDVTIYNIDDTKEKNTVDVLQVGDNVKEIATSEALNENFSEYHIHGQAVTAGTSWTKENVTLSTIIKNDVVTSYRPLIINIDGVATLDILKIKGKWERALRNGRANSYSVKLYDFVQRESTITIKATADSTQDNTTARLWDIGRKVPLIAESLFINDILLIASLSFSEDDNGTNTKLTLVDVSTYSGVTE